MLSICSTSLLYILAHFFYLIQQNQLEHCRCITYTYIFLIGLYLLPKRKQLTKQTLFFSVFKPWTRGLIQQDSSGWKWRAAGDIQQIVDDYIYIYGLFCAFGSSANQQNGDRQSHLMQKCSQFTQVLRHCSFQKQALPTACLSKWPYSWILA